MAEIEFSPAEVRKVKRVQFGVLSPDEIRAMSVGEISGTQTWEGNLPREGGVMDPKLGTISRDYRCKTCSGTRESCPGHFGHIELARPVFHVGFLSITMRILRCVCHHCARLLASPQDPGFKEAAKITNPRARLHAIQAICEKKKTCGSGNQLEGDDQKSGAPEDLPPVGCGNKQPKYRKGQGISIQIEFEASKDRDQDEDRKRAMAAGKVYQIFRRISNNDCRVMGFNPDFCRPDWLLITVLPVSPPAVRPSVIMDGMRPSQDDITHKLFDCIKTNNQLKRQEARGVPEHVLTELVELLQFHACTMMDNEISGQPQAKQKSGKPIKSLRQRLVGKAGRVRGNLMGKRCDFSARTVIGGDPNLSIDQVGVPRSIALNLTYPERVTKYNLHKMKELVENGPYEHPGAKSIIRDDGKTIDLRYVARTSDMNLEPGYTVERHIQNGDVVLFNRQPSLHKMSMMAHFVQILPWSTFRMNLSVTSPYNADFDGDEMNLHVPQSENARAELINLCLVPTQIVSPQANRPVMGIVQDTLLGCMKFTRRDSFLERHQVFNLLMYLDATWDGTIPIPAIVKPKPLWTGKQIFSIILPKVNLSLKANGRPDDEEGLLSATDTLVRIEQGELVCGIVDKKTVGTSSGSLIHVMFNEHGSGATGTFINELNKMIAGYLLIITSSIGIKDTIADTATIKKISQEIGSAKEEVESLINKARNGAFKRQPGSTMYETFEANVNEKLNKAMNNAGKSVKVALHKLNNIKQMVDAGSKGNMINISQIIACVGQQNVQGKRIGYGFSDRTLPHFNKGDLGPEARGFVENSYLKGLTPQEVYFHAMGGREGLVDTAVKTASTGYIQRRLIKAMEDMFVCYDGTVRNSLGHVVQFLYGEDGLDAVHIEKQQMPHIVVSDERFAEAYQFDILSGNENGDLFLEASIKERIRNDPQAQVVLREELRVLREDRRFFKETIFPLIDNEEGFLYLPVNLNRLIWNAEKEFAVTSQSGSKTSSLNPVDVVHRVNELCDKIIIVSSNDETDLIRAEAQVNATMLFKMLVRAKLASKLICSSFGLTKSAFEYIVGEIEIRFNRAIASPGEAVGTIAAQSIGEPATQMTLNTFHYAGVSAKNVTLGVPRLRELINVAQNIKTPSLTVFLKEEIASDITKTKQILNRLEYCRLKDIVARTQIYYDPEPRNSVVEADRDFLDDYFEIPDQDTQQFLSNHSSWMLRLELDRQRKEDKGIHNDEIADRINEGWKGDLKCLFSNDNAVKSILQVRLMNYQEEDEDQKMDEDDGVTEGEDSFLRQLEDKLLNEVELSGISGISKVFMHLENKGIWKADGTFDNKSEKEWVLDTEGSALLEVLAVDEVDAHRTKSNHVIDIFKHLGIEAARKSLVDEIRNVISFDGSYVNYRHLSILVDCMTCGGHLMAITRHGINRRETGPLMRCSFEETVEILYEAAHFSQPDDLLGPSENIMLGQLFPLGTGAFDLLLDQDMLEEHAIAFDDPSVDPFFSTMGSPTFIPTPSYASGATPSQDGSVISPLQAAFSPIQGSSSPLSHDDDDELDYSSAGSMSTSPSYQTPGYHNAGSRFSPASTTGGYTPGSPTYSPTDSAFVPNSPNYSPTSPSYSPTSPGYSPTSPSYSPTSPSYSPTSPSYSPTSPSYSPTSPSYSPTSPSYSPTSPSYSPTSPSYSPTSPSYSPTSPSYSPTSPSYSPTSPSYSPTSPSYSPTSPSYSPTSPSYSPTSPSYSPTSPSYSPTSPSYSPTSPSYSPTSPSYSPTSPSYSPTSPAYSPTSPAYSPTSPAYSPSSPAYKPSSLSPASPSSPTSPSSPLTSPNSPNSPTSPTSPTSPLGSPSSPNSPMGSPLSPIESPSYSPAEWGNISSGLESANIAYTSSSLDSDSSTNDDDINLVPDSSELSSSETADESSDPSGAIFSSDHEDDSDVAMDDVTASDQDVLSGVDDQDDDDDEEDDEDDDAF